MPSAARKTRVEFIALTGDDALLEQIGQTLDGESTFRHAESVEAASAFIRPLRPCVLLLDARGHQDLAAIVESVQSRDGTCIVVVFTPVDESANVSRSVRGSATFAVLPIPVEQGQTMAVLEGAREEALARFTLVAQPVDQPIDQPIAEPVTPAAPATAQITTPASAPGHPPPPETAKIAAAVAPGRTTGRRASDVPSKASATITAGGSAGGSKRRALTLAVAGAALVAITVAWFTLRGSDSSDRAADATATASAVAKPAVAPPVTAPEVLQSGSTEELLDKARVALRERHYTDPEGDNALVYFRSVLANEPDNDEAKEGLQRIGAVLDERLKSELAQRKFEDVAGTLAHLQLIRPGDPALAQIEGKLVDAQIAAALQAGNVERAGQLLRQASQAGTLPEQSAAHWRDELARRQGDARAQVLAQLVSTRIGEGKLVDPANDSAKAYLAQLRRVPSDPKGLADAATSELQQAYLLKIREAAAQSHREDLDRWLAEARTLGVNPTRLAAAMRDAAPTAVVQPAVSESVRLAQLVQDRINDEHLLEPSQDSALAYLNALRTADPSGSALAASTRALSDKLLEAGRNALADRNFDAAQANAAAARRLGLSMGDVETLERGIAAARTPAKPTPRQVPPSEFKRTRYVPPEYPKEALQKGIRGQVRVSITVDTDGKVKSATVVNSTPAGVFDQSALDAVRRWRFKPIEVDGTGIEATLMTEIVFQPDNAKKP
jgi:TonB family protein